MEIPAGIFSDYTGGIKKEQMSNQRRERPLRVNLPRMAGAIARYDKDLFLDAGPRASYAIERWWTERDPAFRAAYSNGLKRLIAAGCDRDALIWRVMFCEDVGIFNAPPFALPNSVIEEQIKAFRKCRAYYFSDSYFYQFFRQDAIRFEQLVSLPSTLDLYSELLAHFGRNLGAQSHHYLHISKFLVDDYVNTMTGRYYDEEVALLISSAKQIGKRTYSSASHRNWRSNYRERNAAFREYDDNAQVEFREEKRILEECAARLHRSMIWESLLDPDGKHPILRLNVELANELQHGMREGDNILAFDGRPASDWSRGCVAKMLIDRVWQAKRQLGKPILVSVYRDSDEVTLHLKL